MNLELAARTVEKDDSNTVRAQLYVECSCGTMMQAKDGSRAITPKRPTYELPIFASS